MMKKKKENLVDLKIGDVIEETTKYENPKQPKQILEKKIHYRVCEFLGKGGFASCYAVVSVTTNVKYAAKIIPKSSLTRSLAKSKLINEIKIHKNMRHSHIVKFERYFEDHMNVYILLEMCTNQTLMELSKRRKRLTETEVQCYLYQLLTAVAYMQTQHVIHRDLKLGNLFIFENMDLKVGDFGLATKANEKKRFTMCGTPNYIAPEILQPNHAHSYEVDVWSIGVIMYTLLVGTPPFEAESVEATYKKIQDNDYSFPPNVRISDAARRLINRIFTSIPSERPKIEEMRRDAFFLQCPFPRYLPPSILTIALDLSKLQPEHFWDISSELIPSSHSSSSVPMSPYKYAIEHSSRAGVLPKASALHEQKRLHQLHYEKKNQLAVPVPNPNKENTNSANVMPPPLPKSGARQPQKGNNPNTNTSPPDKDRPSQPISSVNTNSATSENQLQQPQQHLQQPQPQPQPQPQLQLPIKTYGKKQIQLPLQEINQVQPILPIQQSSYPPIKTEVRVKIENQPPHNSDDMDIEHSNAYENKADEEDDEKLKLERQDIDQIKKMAEQDRLNKSDQEKQKHFDKQNEKKEKDGKLMKIVDKPNIVNQGRTNENNEKSKRKKSDEDAMCEDNDENPEEKEEVEMLLQVHNNIELSFSVPNRKIALDSHTYSPPPVYVIRWVDYSSKYGLGYLLNTGNSGIFFNDASSIILHQNGNDFDYYDFKVRNGQCIRHSYTLKNYPSEMQKKATLLQHFTNYLISNQDKDDPRAGELKDMLSNMNINNATNGSGKNNTGELIYVRRYFRTSHAILFRLSNLCIQVMFTDHSEIIVSSDFQSLTYTNKRMQKNTYPFDTVFQEARPDLAKRMKYVKDILYHIVNSGSSAPSSEPLPPSHNTAAIPQQRSAPVMV